MMEKVIDITERVPAMKKRRRRRTNFKFIALITIFLLIILVLLYFQLPYSNIKKIDIEGAELRDEAFYLQQSGLQADDSLWGFKTANVEQMIAEIEWIKSVDVKRKFLNDVEITIDEWKRSHTFHKMANFIQCSKMGLFSVKRMKSSPLMPRFF